MQGMEVDNGMLMVHWRSSLAVTCGQQI